MEISYSKVTLSLLMLSSLSTFALGESQKLMESNNGTLDSNYPYDTVTPHHATDGFNLADGWKVTGDMRIGYVNYDYSNDPKNFNPNINKGHKDSRGIYFIPKVSITTPSYNGFSAKITAAGVTDFGINDPLYESRTFAFGSEGESYAILQEAYVQYAVDGHLFLVGAKEISTPMLDADDWYLFANTFQGAYYRNKVYDNIMFAGGYVYKMAGVWDSGADGAAYHTIADSSYVDARDKENADDAGMWVGAFQYSDETHNLQLWNYYAVDLYNTFFAQYDYTVEAYDIKYDIGGQLMNFQDVGGNQFTPIDYSIYSLRLDGKHSSGFDFALGASFYSDGPGAGATLGSWGGYPYFANGMIFHYFEAGSVQNANSYKTQIGYDMSAFGLDGFWTGLRYVYWDLNPEYSIATNGLGQETQESYGLRMSYNHSSGVYFTGTYEYVDLDHEEPISALRLIGGYKF